MSTGVSVIIAAYNVESYIERAIRSALSQQNIPVEVVLVDDASTDKTWDVASRIADPRLKCIRLEQNGGPSVARNAGFAAAQFPWLAVLDGDDILLPDRLARVVKRAVLLNADIVVDNIRVHRESDEASFPMFDPRRFSQLTTLGLARFIAGNQSFLGGEALGYLKPVFSAAFLQRHKLAYDPELRIGEDYMLFAEVLANGGRCAVEHTEGYVYTVRAGSISHRLSLADVTRITKGDRKFVTRYALTADAAKAQQKRESRLQEAYIFTQLIDALKQRQLMTALKTILRRPTVIVQLWRPIHARIKRIGN